MTRLNMHINPEPEIIITPEATYVDGYEFYPKSISIVLGNRKDYTMPRETITFQELLALADNNKRLNKPQA